MNNRTGQMISAGKRPFRKMEKPTDGVMLSGTRTADGWHSGDALLREGAEGASGRSRQTLRQKDRGLAHLTGHVHGDGLGGGAVRSRRGVRRLSAGLSFCFIERFEGSYLWRESEKC